MQQNAPVVWIVDSEQWPRACLRAELIERGCDVRAYLDLDAALADAARGFPPPRVLVLELGDQKLDEARLDALERLGAAVVVLGRAIDLADPLVRGRRFASIMPRPVSLGEVADKVEALAAVRT